MRSLISTSTALALATGGFVLLSSPAATSTPAAAASSRVSTPFALATSGFGSRARGGDAPAGSESTAFAVISCTNNAGVVHENHESALTVPGLGTLSNVMTKVWTSRGHGTVSAYSRHTIARLTVPDSTLGSLSLNGISSLSRAFHNRSGFHSKTATRIGSITLTPTGGESQQLPAPTPDQPLVIPGVATISLGRSYVRHDGAGAAAKADALRIKLTQSNTSSLIAHTHAQIARGVKSGVFSGRSSGTDFRASDGHLTSGRTPLSIMPCQGTEGSTLRKGVAHSKPDDRAVARNLNTRQRATQTATRAHGYEQGSIDRLNLNNGQLVVTGVVGRANVTRTASGVTRNVKGTTVGRVRVDGELQKFPRTDVLKIPGVARLERSVVDRSATGVSVIALRITLLDGSGAILNLGRASLHIRDAR